jgi:MFS family permease
VRASPTFWLLTAANMFGAIAVTGIIPHVVAIATASGLKAAYAVAALSVITIFQLLGQLAGGVFLDRVHSAKVAAPFLLVLLFGLILIGLASPASGGAAMLYGGVAMTGFGVGATRNMALYFMTRFFGVRALGEIAGLNTAIAACALAPAPLLLGLLYDLTGGYRIGVLIIASLCLVAGGLYLAAPAYRYPATAKD